MLRRHVHQLDSPRVVVIYDQRDIGEMAERPAIAAEQGNHRRTLGARDPGRREQVRALPAGAVQDQQVALRHQCLDLPGIRPLESEVVAGGREHGDVGAKRHRRIGRPIGVPMGIPDDILGSAVLGIGGTAAVPGKEQRAAIAQRGGEACGDGIDGRGVFRGTALEQRGQRGEGLLRGFRHATPRSRAGAGAGWRSTA